MAAVEEKVKQIIVEQLGVDEGEGPPAPRSWTTLAPTRWTLSS